MHKVKRITLKQGDVLLSPGKINESVFIIISGHLSVQITPSLQDDPISILTSGDCVGEMSVLVDNLVSTYVIATTNSELFSVDYSSFWSLLNSSNEAARNMLNILVQKIRLGNEIVADSLLHRDTYLDGIYDNLTGLYNRHGMHGKFDRLKQRCSHDKQPLCLIVLEVDHLTLQGKKAEEFADNQPLRTIALKVLNILRPDDHAARLGGNMFAILLANTPLADANVTSDRLCAAIRKTHITLPNGNVLPPFAVSTHVSEALSTNTWNEMITLATLAMEQKAGAVHN